MLIYIHIIFIFGIFLITTYFVQIKDVGYKHLYNPWVIFAYIYILYTISPLTDAVILTDQLEIIKDFLLFQLIGILGLSFGCFMSYYNVSKKEYITAIKLPQLVKYIPANNLVFVLIIVQFILMFYAIYEYKGGIAQVIGEGYAFYTGIEYSPLDTIIMTVITYGTAALLTAVFFLYNRLSVYYKLFIALYAFIILVQGHRNLMIMYMGSILLLHSIKHGRLSYKKVLSILLVTFIIFMLVGLYRNFGFYGYEDFVTLLSNVGLTVFIPANQELNTSFNVFRIYNIFPDGEWGNWYQGESYVRAMLSIIPKYFWVDRPDAIATYFSKRFAVSGEGLGFSFNLEAYINFGIFGIFFLNAIFMYLIMYVYNKYLLSNTNLFGVAFYQALVLMSFNINRIDTQTVFKLSSIVIVAFIIYYKIVHYISTPTDKC